MAVLLSVDLPTARGRSRRLSAYRLVELAGHVRLARGRARPVEHDRAGSGDAAVDGVVGDAVSRQPGAVGHDDPPNTCDRDVIEHPRVHRVTRLPERAREVRRTGQCEALEGLLPRVDALNTRGRRPLIERPDRRFGFLKHGLRRWPRDRA